MEICFCCKPEPKKKIVLLLIGLDNAGKTVTAKGLARESRKAVIPTVGFSVIHLKYRNANVNIYDLGGGAQIRSIWPLYYADAHGVIFVIDASDYKRLNDAKRLLTEVLTDEKISGKPLLLLANKQDVAGALDELDVVEKLKVEDLVNQQRCPTLVKSCSAIDVTSKDKFDEAIEKGYSWLLNLILRDYWKLNARVERDLREQQVRNLNQRKELLKRIKKDEIQSNGHINELDIEGGGDNGKLNNLEPKLKSYNDFVYESQSDDDSRDSSKKSSVSSPRVYFENTITKIDEIITLPVVEVKKRRRLFARSNKTAPATLLGAPSAEDGPITSNTSISPIRRFKSAEPNSDNVQILNPSSLYGHRQYVSEVLVHHTEEVAALDRTEILQNEYEKEIDSVANQFWARPSSKTKSLSESTEAIHP